MAGQQFNNAFAPCDIDLDWSSFQDSLIPATKLEGTDMTRSESYDSAYYSQPGVDGIDSSMYDSNSYMYPTQYQQQYAAGPETTPLQQWSQSSWDTLDYSNMVPNSAGPTYTTVQSPGNEVYHISSSTDNALRFENTKKEYTCLRPGCGQKPFGRSADLDRHYKQVHLPSHQKESYFCDYKKCGRAAKDKEAPAAFHRKDHFRDHLRDYHHEDLPKRGSKDNGSAWLHDRWVDARWWRCGKCLKRTAISKFGWECPDCKIFCENDRKQARLAAASTSSRQIS